MRVLAARWTGIGHCVLLALLLSSSLRAQDDRTARLFLEQQDSNGDGRISRNEWEGSGASFLRYDRDRNAYIELAELAVEPSAKKATGATLSFEERVAGLPIAIAEFREPSPEYFGETCMACHNDTRILAARKDGTGWAETVKRMGEKEEAAFSEGEGRRVVRYLEGLREDVARNAIRFESANPRVAWGRILDGARFHHFDRDRNGRLTSTELSRLVMAQLDFDGDGELNAGEFRLMPLGGQRGKMFRRFDRNHNGTVSLREMGVPAGMMEILDSDGDGSVHVEELPRMRRGPYRLFLATDATMVLEVLDRNRDGLISRREAKNADSVFQLADRDRNSKLDRAEIEAALATSRAISVAFEDFLTRYDMNGDGRVEEREFPGPVQAFRRCDTNEDGVLTSKDGPSSYRRPEFNAAAERWR